MLFHLALSSLVLGVLACLVSACGDNFTLQVGQVTTIQSPNFPQSYVSGLECLWTVYSPANTLINLKCYDFDVKFCSMGALYVSPTGDHTLSDVHYFCGKVIVDFSSTTNALLVNFWSFPHIYNFNRGFYCSFTVVKNEPTTTSTTTTATTTTTTATTTTPTTATPTTTTTTTTTATTTANSTTPTPTTTTTATTNPTTTTATTTPTTTTPSTATTATTIPTTTTATTTPTTTTPTITTATTTTTTTPTTTTTTTTATTTTTPTTITTTTTPTTTTIATTTTTTPTTTTTTTTTTPTTTTTATATTTPTATTTTTTTTPTTTTTTTTTSTTRPQNKCLCGIKGGGESRVVQGVETDIHEWPWQGSLLHNASGEPFCGASVIASQWVLTAAHCLVDLPKEQIHVILGEHNLNVSHETLHTRNFSVDIIILHEDYNPNTVENDIGLIKLDHPITYSKATFPVCLPFGFASSDFKGENATVTGWGTTSFNGEQSEVLLEATLSVLTTTECKVFYGDKVTSNMFCTYEPGKDACQGDSGGPLNWVNPDTGRTICIGIVSWGGGCGDVNNPGVYTKITNYLDWIKKKTQAHFCIDGSS